MDPGELTYYRGRVALRALLAGLGVGDGDLVATQAFTCVAVPEGIIASGARPLWIDCAEGQVNMDPAALAAKLGQRVRAVVIQHTFGIPAEMDALMRICDERELPVIEDCCHTYASTYRGQKVGTFGAGAFYSFEWGKPLVAGIGGAATCSDEALSAKLHDELARFETASALRRAKVEAQYWAFRLLYSPGRYWSVRAAFQALSRSGAAEGNYGPSDDYNLRMNPHCRARLRAQIERAAEIADHARWCTGKYDELLNVERPAVPEGAETVYARYPFLTDQKSAMLKLFESKGVELADWYRTPIHPSERDDWHQVDYEPGDCPRAEKLSERLVSLPTNFKTGAWQIEAAARLLSEG